MILRQRQRPSLVHFPFSLLSFLHTTGASLNPSRADLLEQAILLGLARRDTGIDASHGAELPPYPFERTTDIAELPAQICGIVGAYFLTVIVIGFCILTCGRRKRREAQYGSGLVTEVEMYRPLARQYQAPPSPTASTKSWVKIAFGKRRKSSISTTANSVGIISTPVSPGVDPAHKCFDAALVQQEKDRAQREMESLYAAVMEHDAKKKASRTALTAVGDNQEPRSPHPYSSSDKPKDKRLHRLVTGRHTQFAHDLASPISPYSSGNGPQSPVSPVRAIYPPDDSSSFDGQRGPRSPVNNPSGRFPGAATIYPGLPPSPRSNRDSRASSTSPSTTSKSRRAPRTLRINTPATRNSIYDNDGTPLSPAMPTPRTAMSYASNATGHTVITEDSDDGDNEDLDRPGPLPRPAPPRSGSWHLDNISTANAKSAASSTSTLPLRSQPGAHHGADVPHTPVKTTYLETKQRGIHHGPRTAAGLTPVGVPMTPYSPYMPFTPITPVTPHLTSKRELKLKQREGRRRVMARDEGDLVEEEGEIFGSAY